MSDDAKNEMPAGVPQKRSGMGAVIVGMLLPAIVAGAVSYGSVRAAAKNAAHGQSEEPAHKEAKPPGPTVALEPFLVSLQDANKKAHPMKLTIAVEFAAETKEEALKGFTLRIRDAVLAHMRALSFEEASENAHADKLRADLLARCHEAGAASAERVLITDLVSQ